MIYGLKLSYKLDILSLELCVGDFKLTAIKLYENNDFVKIGAIPGAAKVDGVYVDEYLYVRNSQELIDQLVPLVEGDTNKNDIEIKICCDI